MNSKELEKIRNHIENIPSVAAMYVPELLAAIETLNQQLEAAHAFRDLVVRQVALTVTDNLFGGADKEPPSLKVVVEQILAEHGVGVDSVRPGRASHMRLHARSGARVISGLTPGAQSVVVHQEEKRPWAKVYVTKERRRGQAQFSANGYWRDGSPDIYLFVLLSERRAWIATKKDLAALEDGLRSGDGHPGVGVLTKTPGTLRLWFSRAESATNQFELHNRVKPALVDV